MQYLQRKAIFEPTTQHLARLIGCSWKVHRTPVTPNPGLLGNDSVAGRFKTVEMRKRVPYQKDGGNCATCE